jgi:cell division protein ZipA
MLIQLFVVAVGEPFAGARILAAAKRLKLMPGSMDIFHRLASDDGDRAPLYSMANLVKPGSFPLSDMHGFRSPGLALFAQLGGDPSDLMVYDEMLHVARALAADLGGEVQERGRQPLTDERAKALRVQVSALLQRAPRRSKPQ